MNNSPKPPSRLWRGLGIVAVATLTIGAAFVPVPQASASDAFGDVRLVVTTVNTQPIGRGAGSSTVDITVANTSSNIATHAVVLVSMPAGVSADLNRSSDGCSMSSGNVRCVIDTISAGNLATITVGVSVGDPDTAVGVRSGSIAPITADQHNVAGPQIALREWDHESDGQGADLQRCWPVSNPSPNMDIDGGGISPSAACDGVNDHAAAAPDRVTYFENFPSSVSGNFTRSWEIEFEIAVPTTDSYRLCAQNVDDGGYVAIVPERQTPTPADVKFTTSTWGPSFTSSAFTLSAGTRYRVLYRVSNRGGPGVDNGGAGLGGFGPLGLAPSSRTCAPSGDVAAFDATSPLRSGAELPIDIRPSSNLQITGALVGSTGTKTISAANVANVGHDPTSAKVMINAAIAPVTSGADCVMSTGRATCVLGIIAPNSNSAIALEVAPGNDQSVAWDFNPSDSLEANMFDNRVKLTQP